MNYEYTQTLHPTMYTMSALDQFRITSAYMHEVLKGYRSSCVAELTSAHNVHYHATVYLASHKDRDRFINRTRRYKSFGKRSISALVHEPKWIEYLNKSKEETREIIGDPILTDDFCILCDPQYRFCSDDQNDRI